MFLDALLRTNPGLATLAARAIRDGRLSPGTYVLDLTAVDENAEVISAAARLHGIQLYAMSKQVGRNPDFIRAVSRHIPKWVAVDLVDARAIVHAGGRLGHVGHLVQPGRAEVARMLELRPEIVTVFSLDLAEHIAAEARRQGLSQSLMARIAGPVGALHPGQPGGIALEGLEDTVEQIRSLRGVTLDGVTGYPCVVAGRAGLALSEIGSSVLEAASRISGLAQVNGPGNTCTSGIPLLRKLGFTHGEPGHGLTGTTPLHAIGAEQPERVAMLFATQVSHRLDADRVAIFGGGFYARGNAAGAQVYSRSHLHVGTLEPHPAGSIDYYRTLRVDGDVRPGDPVVLAFRFQAFVTRAPIATVVSHGHRTRIVGVHDAFGHPWS